MAQTIKASIRRFFPEVEEVVDAKRPIYVEVTSRDNNSATVKNHKACAMAVACKRAMKADGVVISLSTAYVVKGKKAIRFKLPASVAREVTAFDRNATFEPGEYRLTPASPSGQLGAYGRKHPKGNTGTGPRGRLHMTTNVRTSLRSRDAV